MTVVAWDGNILAADKQATNNGLKRTVTKIRKVNGCLIFAVNDFDTAMELYAWYERGAKVEDWPAVQSDKDRWTPLNIIKPDKTIWVYERSPYPFQIEQKQLATGSGRDYALAAMHMGADAVKAVEIACHFEISCGLGIDVLTLDAQ